MQRPDNISHIESAKPDYFGFIFYPKSKRVVNDQTLSYLRKKKRETKRVGVFVNHDIEDIKSAIIDYGLDAVQLHGDESPSITLAIKTIGITVIKAFQINAQFDWVRLEEYYDSADYFLFDTATSSYGGSGKKFNWTLLEEYALDKPFFLSGGISPDDSQVISELNLPHLYAIDLNSQFEIEPGLKDYNTISQFINKVNG